MSYALTTLSCACALGRNAAEVLDAARSGVAPGFVEVNDEVPSRRTQLGLVPGELPVVAEAEYNMRSCQLVRHALTDELRSAVARFAPERVAIILGASNTGIHEAQGFVNEWLECGTKPAAMNFSMIELGTPAEFLRRELGTRGPAYVVSTACSSAAKAFASAQRLIECGLADMVVTGGVDSRCRFAANGFAALGALSENPTRPLTVERDGINLGEAVALFTLERSERGVLLAGVGETSDAYHATAPDPEGRGAEAAMRAALAAAGLTPDEIDYINLHGTGTHANDAMEAKAVARIFGERVACASTKQLTGHCLGAAGAIEAALGWLMITHGCSIAHLMRGNYDTALPALKLADGTEKVTRFMSNSFAFGGSNASIILTRGEQ